MGMIQCPYCCALVDAKDFYPNYNKYMKTGKMQFCKKCSQEIVADILKNNTWEIAIRNICVLFNIPYRNDVMLKLKEKRDSSTKERSIDYIFQYVQTLKELGVPNEHWSELSGNSMMHQRLIKDKDVKCKEDDMDMFAQLASDWGEQYDTLDDYLWLEEKFYTYSNGEELTPAMITTLRYLCASEFDVMRLKKSKPEQKELETAEKRVMEYYKRLKLDDFKLKNQKSLIETTIEDWAFVHENVEPLVWEDENLKDRLGIDKDYDNIMRSLGNKVVGSTNYPKLTTDDVEKKR